MQIATYIFRSFTLFMWTILIKAILSGIIRYNIGLYSKSSLTDNLWFSLVVGLIWEAPWYLIYFVAFMVVVALMRHYSRVTLPKTLILVLLLDMVVSYRLLDDFDILLRIGSVPMSAVCESQVIGHFRFLLILVFSLAFGMLYHRNIEQAYTSGRALQP